MNLDESESLQDRLSPRPPTRSSMRSQASALSRRQSTLSLASGRKSFVRRHIADHKVKAQRGRREMSSYRYLCRDVTLTKNGIGTHEDVYIC